MKTIIREITKFFSSLLLSLVMRLNLELFIQLCLYALVYSKNENDDRYDLQPAEPHQ